VINQEKSISFLFSTFCHAVQKNQLNEDTFCRIIQVKTGQGDSW